MSSKLKILRSNLESLRKKRSGVRSMTAFSGFLAAAIWVVFLCFLLDWSLAMDGLQRAFLMLISIAVLVASFRRYASPHLGQSENIFQMALLVEKTKGINTDLIAALQFEDPEAEAWGSVELQDAVKDKVAEMSPSLDVFEGYSAGSMGKRVAIFLAVSYTHLTLPTKA